MNEAIQIFKKLRTNFNSGTSKSYEFRVSQLKKLLSLVDDNEAKIYDSLYADLHKNKYDAMCTTTMIIKNQIIYVLKNLKYWMKPEYVEKDMVQSINSPYIIREPFGVVLIISSWNYPIQLTLVPLIGALCAGNAAIIKPSPFSVACTSLLKELIPKYLDPEFYAVLEGDGDFTASLIENVPFDYIFYTGSTTVGKQIMRLASNHLTPVTLELGGKSPAVMLSDCDVHLCAKRILWGKFANCGQTCIAPDYVICQSEAMKLAFIQAAKEILELFYGPDAKTSDSYGRIINSRHFERLQTCLKDCKIEHGGNVDAKENYIEPTIVTLPNNEHALMKDEIFGPILPVMVIENLDEIIAFINDRDKPLSLYIFTNDKMIQNTFLAKTSSGGVCINDVFMHYTYESLPFGGVGKSGMGKYHGKFSFDTFSNLKACLDTAIWSERLNELRYPPYTDNKSKWMTWLLGKKL